MKCVEKSVAKGEIPHYEHILFLSECFQKSSACWKGLKINIESWTIKCTFSPVFTLTFKNLALLHKQTLFKNQQQTNFENIVAKEEIAHDEQFLLFVIMFSTLFNTSTFIKKMLRLFSTSCWFVVLGKGLTCLLYSYCI